MNQPEVRIKYEKCLECNKKIAMRYHYDRHLSDWVCYEIPLCDECKGIVKPDVVLYEEPLDYDVVKGAISEIEKADFETKMLNCVIIENIDETSDRDALYEKWLRANSLQLHVNKTLNESSEKTIKSSSSIVLQTHISFS